MMIQTKSAPFMSTALLGIILSMTAFPILPEARADRDGEIRISYIRTLPYGNFSDMTKKELAKTGFHPDRQICILVKILASVKRRYYNSACYNVSSSTNDPCQVGTNIIYVVSKKDYPIFRREKYIDMRTIFLFRQAVYGQYIPQGIYPFLTDYQGK